ncbi:UBP9-binding protein [Lasiodiplodia hormozganensis]|uniref:UBP9-binding protein n=1 Tax=Lasiodiplodia hormozganensis TaxID=869390 RepID=A0AA39Y6C3_9PEZI|nr:UBP9-binding protein [Lasiodiplodia hormozganensis]
MGRNARKRISYVLPLANSAAGHRLGVNGLAVDPYNSILYSGGRDGVICAWDTHLDLRPAQEREGYGSLAGLDDAPPAPKPATTFRQQVQAHTHWINDIILAQNNEALVSASSDISVKLWRPASHDALPPQTLGLHSDYVKCLASPSPTANWVASGGLDRKINLWDLNGGGKTLQISVGEDESTAKGSVYALAATNSLIASGGPESIVRVWDSRSGKRITKFVGHTDNIRDILIAKEGDTIMTASSDQTVKVWSMTAGRCMYTLTMHNDSVWSLYSDHPQLSVFYSSDRSGLVAKTDVRGCIEMDEGLSVAVCQEHGGVSKVAVAGDYVWTATSSSSINRWQDVNTEADVQLPDNKHHRLSSATARTRIPSPTSPTSPPSMSIAPPAEKIPRNALLRMSNAASFHLYRDRDQESATLHSVASLRKQPELIEDEAKGPTPMRPLPDFSIEGQNGLIKHFLLSDRRRVLTLDTAGEVMLWDLLKCAPIKSFGKRHLEDVAPEVNTTETVAHWCAVDTRTGSLTCVLEENYCFDAEMYADELQLEEAIEFREDQRINLGKWILRYLFANLIDEEIKRDESFRQNILLEKKQQRKSPGTIEIPDAQMNGWKEGSAPSSATTLRANNGFHLPVTTPGLAIGVATPGGHPHAHTHQTTNHLPPTAEEGTQLEQSTSGGSKERNSGDYFSTSPRTQAATTPSSASQPRKSGEAQSPTDGDKENNKEGTMFGRKFKMSFGGMKKLGRTTTSDTTSKPSMESPTETPEESDSHTSKSEDRVIEDNLLGVIQAIRHRYEDEVQEGAQNLTSAITPSLANETPVLKPPIGTSILIQEDRPDSGGVADLFEGTVGSLGQQADFIEKVAPKWLGEVLLKNTIPFKEIVKVSFILEPYQNILPAIASDGNNRLNANRMLRARKIMAYVAERIEPPPEQPDPNALRPEEYLELYCNNQLISPTMTLATIRAHVWRGGGDVILYYKANGRKEIKHAQPAPPEGPHPPYVPPNSNIPLTPGSPGLVSPAGFGSGLSPGSPARSPRTSGEGRGVPGSYDPGKAMPP